MNKDRIR